MTDRTQHLKRVGGYVYFRYTRVRLPWPEGSPEFNAAWDREFAAWQRGLPSKLRVPTRGRPRKAVAEARAANKLVSVTRDGRKVYHPPSLGWFIERYRASGFFRPGHEDCLAEGTREQYRYGLDELCEQLGEGTLRDLTPRLVELHVAKVKREQSSSTARLHRQLISNLWEFAKGFPEFDPGDRGNPVLGTKSPYKVRKPHEPWPDDVQETFLGAASEPLRLAFYLLLYTGQRGSDVVKMKWSHFIDGERMKVVQQKTQKTNEPLILRVPKALLRILKGVPREGEFILNSTWGRRYAHSRSLSHRVKRTLRAALGEEAAEAWTMHGLRKNAGIMLAENGATVPQIMAVLGHKTPAMAIYYVEQANKKKLADQGADILDVAIEAKRIARAKVRRGALRRVV